MCNEMSALIVQGHGIGLHKEFYMPSTSLFGAQYRK